MKIGVIGVGYVGLTTAICLASMKHEISIFDINDEKIKQIYEKKLPFFEKGLQEMLENVISSRNLIPAKNLNELVDNTEGCFICVGTPTKSNSIDLTQIINAVKSLADSIKQNDKNDYKIIIRSTIIPNTARNTILPILSDKLYELKFGLSVVPEFLREGNALDDFMNPDKIVIGGSDVTYWNEDYWWGVGNGNITSNPSYNSTGPGAYDCTFHDNGEENWAIVNSTLMVAGNLGVVEAGGSLVNYYWEIYHLMGDPSLATYYGIPVENNLTHTEFLPVGSTSISISGEPYTYVGITHNGNLLGSGQIGPFGNIELSLSGATIPGTAQIVGTCQNHQPYFGEILIASPEGPYVMVESSSFTSGYGSNDEDEVIQFGDLDIIFASTSRIRRINKKIISILDLKKKVKKKEKLEYFLGPRPPVCQMMK